MSRSFFFIAGAQRSGTTYLYHLLDQHPQICMAKPVKPEPKFFLNNREFVKGSEYYQNKFYPANSDKKIFGEKSTSYIESETAAHRIKDMFPDAKILFILRNPVFRAISNYFFSIRNKLESRTISEVFVEKKIIQESSDTSVSPYKYIERGEYTKYLKVYLDIFPSDRIKVVLFEEMVGNNNIVKEVYDFLGAETSFEPKNIEEKINANDIDQPVDPQIINYLYRHFQTHNKQLEDLLGIDLTLWERTTAS